MPRTPERMEEFRRELAEAGEFIAVLREFLGLQPYGAEIWSRVVKVKPRVGGRFVAKDD